MAQTLGWTRPWINSIVYLGELTLMFVRALRTAFLPPVKWERYIIQAKRVGPESFFLASLVAFFIGVIIALQMAYQMTQLSSEIYIPNVIAISLTRELAPVLTSLVVAGRIGAGITAEIGTMKVTEQIDALRAFGVDPVRYLVSPRLVGLMVMLPVLAVFADLIGIFGGFVICVYKLNIPGFTFVNMVIDALTVKDVLTGLTKTVIFAVIIALVGCHAGMGVTSGAEGVGRATTRSVVLSFLLIIVADCFITALFYFILRA